MSEFLQAAIFAPIPFWLTLLLAAVFCAGGFLMGYGAVGDWTDEEGAEAVEAVAVWLENAYGYSFGKYAAGQIREHQADIIIRTLEGGLR